MSIEQHIKEKRHGEGTSEDRHDLDHREPELTHTVNVT